MNDILLLIDANALIHRAFHALPPLTTPDGKPIGAIYGLTNALLKILKELKPAYVAAAFDRPEPTFRKEISETYKAHRPPTPNELVTQIQEAHELFKELGIMSFEKPGFEADDIIGTLTKKFNPKSGMNGNLKIVILTGDLDTLQLVWDGKIVVMAPKKGISETKIYDETAVRERFGISPEQITDYKSLVGDPSDNIPGIKGIGPKTAAKILQEFNDTETLYEKMPKNHPLAAKILPQENQARLSKKLATLNSAVPIAIDLQALTYQGLETQKLVVYFTKLGFSSIIERLLRSGRDATPLKENTSLEKAEPPTELLIIQNIEDIPPKKELDSTKLKIAFDWKPIFKRLNAEKTAIRGPFFDLKIASWLLDPDQEDLSPQAFRRRFLYRDSNGDEETSFFELFQFLKGKIKEYELDFIFEKIEMPTIEILASMESWGVQIDAQTLTLLEAEIGKELERLTYRIYEMAGETFNINSPKQIARVLFEKLNLKKGKARKTVTGQRSTSEETLLEVQKEHPIIESILAYREDFKIKTSFVAPLLESREPSGRLHTTFLQTGTATGRLASEKPNLQNIPQESKWSKNLRKSFVAENGFSLVALDYSQLELRLLAHVSKDPKLIHAFLENKDIHQLTASQIFNTPLEKVTPEMRRLGKTLNFGIVYGMSARGLSRASGLPPTEAEEFIAEYFHDFPEIQKWQETVKKEARTFGYVKNLNGRRRWLFNINSPNERLRAETERQATNMPIQSLGADIIKLAMIRSFELLKKKQWLGEKARLILSIHDELLFEIRDDILKEITPLLQKIMESVYPLNVPLKIEIKIGKNWGEIKNLNP